VIGKVITGASFYHCISYCLEDKQGLKNDPELLGTIAQHLQHKDRAEVLYCNRCMGDKNELTEQFTEVQHLSKRIEKPVLHLTLRLAPGEVLNHNQWIEAAQQCAEAFGVGDHQYFCVLHKDTQQPHVHIVANRVGFDGKVASDSNSYRKMAEVCRQLEKQFGLRQILSPRAFLPPAYRILPRQDLRKQAMGKLIWTTLQKASTFNQFEEMMKRKGVSIIKGRGIVFMDNKKMRVKGSELGFPLSKLEQVFHLKRQHTAAVAVEEVHWEEKLRNAKSPTQRMMVQFCN
jgi:hypothetical protein